MFLFLTKHRHDFHKKYVARYIQISEYLLMFKAYYSYYSFELNQMKRWPRRAHVTKQACCSFGIDFAYRFFTCSPFLRMHEILIMSIAGDHSGCVQAAAAACHELSHAVEPFLSLFHMSCFNFWPGANSFSLFSPIDLSAGCPWYTASHACPAPASIPKVSMPMGRLHKSGHCSVSSGYCVLF
jgi:hypothetical protein